ncbi:MULTISPECIES: hypothetical protein [unclassified Pseudofrankia]|uniref:hypothetical protein n=1 Tax=unclassified Pseudofrankia TaxID=2994372 RepID=UPI0008D9C10D|nr:MULTISPECIES: hypothetical protein [unclassified Pseudofrankia]MDT3442027.1 hypothetical protein [Pseudofrankia sp. BMG5.37]OHV69205.1 hypothetical protein BCD48_35000 [Pseudofrankia sp. BMG5.36]
MAEQLVPSRADVPDFQADPDTHTVPGTPDVAGSRGVAGPRRTEPRRTEPRWTGPARGRTGPGTPRGGDAEGGGPGGDPDRRVQAARAAWRAAAAATADPRWARPGTAAAWPGWDAVYPEPGAYGQAAASGPAGADARPRHRGAPPGEPAGAPGGRGATAVPRAAGAATGWLAATAPMRSGWWPRGRVALVLPAALAAAGALLTVISSTMTWATVRAFGLVEYSVAGLDADQHGRLTLGLGIITGLAAAGLAVRPRGHTGRLVAGLSGVMGLTTTLVALIDIGYLRGGGLLAGPGVQATTVIGPGLWLVLVGGLLAIAAALLALPGPGWAGIQRGDGGNDSRADGRRRSSRRWPPGRSG